MKGMILAAGFGTRFRPATYEIPKPLIPLCNRPLAAWALEAMLADGVREVVVNLHHLPEMLETWLREHYGARCDFVFSREETILGTGGGIRRVREHLDGDGPFVVANGDTVQQPPFGALADLCRRDGALAALLLRYPPAHDRFTKVFFERGRVTGFGAGTGEALMFAGAHAISPAVFDLLPDRPFSGITEDVYVPAVRAGSARLSGMIYDGLWFDIGTPARYLEASQAVRRRMAGGRVAIPEGSAAVEESIVASTARVEGRIVESVIGEDASVAPGATVTGSVVWEGAEIGAGARVRDAIVGRGVRLPDGARVRNALVCRRLEGADYSEGIILAGEAAVAAIRPEDALEYEP
ncbi:MAG: sugar phosphate nucleotidyltransferase [Thermoanaerobaculia bacterium]